MTDNIFRDFATRVAQLYIAHPQVEHIWGMIDSLRAHNKLAAGKNSPRHLLITGDSGVGKTQLIKQYAQMNPGYVHVDEEGTEYDIKPVVYMELPDPFTVLEFYQSIVKALGAPQLAGRPTIGEVKRQAFKLLEMQKVEVLLLDEINFLLTSKHVKPKDGMETIKHVANSANISLVCVGLPIIETLRNSDFQYIRRYPLVKLKKFEQDDDAWCNFLEKVEEKIGSPHPLRLGDRKTMLPTVLFQMTKGYVGILTPLLQEMYRLLGVFDDDFNDFNRVKFTSETIDILWQAYRNIFGDLTTQEFDSLFKLEASN